MFRANQLNRQVALNQRDRNGPSVVLFDRRSQLESHQTNRRGKRQKPPGQNPAGENRIGFSGSDLFVNWHRFSEANLKLGQFKAPFGVEQTTPDTALFTAERSLATGALTPERQIGAQLWGTPLARLWPGAPMRRVVEGSEPPWPERPPPPTPCSPSASPRRCRRRGAIRRLQRGTTGRTRSGRGLPPGTAPCRGRTPGSRRG